LDPVYKQFEEASREIGIGLDNIELGVGAYGVSVQAKDTSQPIGISIPKNVLLPGAQVDYGTNKVKEDVEISDQLREYWNFYLGLSLGERAIQRRQDVENAIAKEGLEAWMQDENISALQAFLKVRGSEIEIRRYLAGARTFAHAELGPVHMPYLDFVNHKDASRGFKVGDSGMWITGETDTKEVFVSYGLKDPLMLLDRYGFVTTANYLFSTKSQIALPSLDCKITVGRNVTRTNYVDGVRAGPKIEKIGNRIDVSFCLLAARNMPMAVKKSWQMALDHATNLTAKEKQSMNQFRSVIINRNFNLLWQIYRRSEEVQDEGLRTVMMDAAAQSIRLVK